MQVATWNVNSIRTREAQVLTWLEEHPVDILCLQETKVIDRDFPSACFQALGYHIYIFGQKAYNGVACLSKHPLEAVNLGFSSLLGADFALWDEQKRVISATIDKLRVVNVYVPNGAEVGSDKYNYKLQWLEILKNYLQVMREQFSEEICLCGDFNIALEDRDIYNPQGKDNHIMASPAERAALREILALGFQDAFRKFTEETGYFSWWDYRQSGFSKNRGWRIDHLYLTNNLYEKATNCTIDKEARKQEKPSDHAPVIVEF
jgi:exodeoxyribonuclease-3